MTKKKKTFWDSQLCKRISSFLWRAGALAFIAGGTYILKIGDIWKLDYRILVNLVVIAVVTLTVSEITKYLNNLASNTNQ